jgi:hypothetical protein
MSLAPNQQCDSCAFRPKAKTGAASEVHNRLKGQICALSGVAFSCHHAPDGRELDWRGSPADFIRSLNGRRDLRVCAGWKAAVHGFVRRGYFKSNRIVRHALGQYAMHQMEIFLGKDIDAAEKEEARVELGRTLMILTKRESAKR